MENALCRIKGGMLKENKERKWIRGRNEEGERMVKQRGKNQGEGIRQK